MSIQILTVTQREVGPFMDKTYSKHVLTARFIMTLCIMGVLVYFWHSHTAQIQQNLITLRDEFKVASLIHTMSEASRQRALTAHRMLIMDDEIDRFDEQEVFYSMADKFITAREQLFIHPSFDGETKILWDEIKSSVNAGAVLHNKVVENLIEDNDKKALMLLKKDSKVIQDKFINNFNKILDVKRQEVDNIVTATTDLNEQYLAMIIVVSGVGLLIMVPGFFYGIRFVSKTETRLHKAREIEKSANEYKTEFLARASHELRTPLNSILGFAQVINMDKDNRLSLEHASYFKHIEASGWHLLTLVDDILDLSRISEGNIRLNIESVSVESTLKECYQSLAEKAKKQKIQCQYDVSELTNDIIDIDKARFNQILSNLASNAIKYNYESGMVFAKVIDTPEKRIRIEIQNTGSGIKPEEMELLFKPFSRVGGINEADGKGIGLVLCKALIEFMGGEIGVESKPGATTTFWVELPRNMESNEDDLAGFDTKIA